MDPTATELARLLQKRFRVTPEESTDLSTLGIDSLSMADFIGEIEEHFQIEVDQDIFEVATFGELSEYVQARLPESGEHH